MSLNLTMPVNSLGYGVAATNIAVELYKHSAKTTIFPIRDSLDLEAYSAGHKSKIEYMVNNRRVYDRNAPSIRIWHQNDLAQHVGKGLHISFPFFELDKFDLVEKHHLGAQDLILTTSEWGKKVIADNGITVPVEVVPLGVDRSIFFDQPNPNKIVTRFLNVGKWEIRKGHDILIEAFGKAFTAKDNVELLLACSNPFLTSQEQYVWQDRLNNCPLRSKITVLQRFKTFEQLANVMRNVDVGVFPSHAEGWNLELLEMMSCGKRVIATLYSAHTEFLTNENASVLDPTGMTPAHDGKWFHGQGNWCTFDIDQLISEMQYMHKLKQEEGTLDNPAGVITAEKFSWGNSAQRILEATGLAKPAAVVV